jgi:hypothetical protein
VAVVDAGAKRAQFVGVPVVPSFDQIAGGFDAVLITDLQSTAETLEKVLPLVGAERTLMPTLLGVRAFTAEVPS